METGENKVICASSSDGNQISRNLKHKKMLFLTVGCINYDCNINFYEPLKEIFSNVVNYNYYKRIKQIGKESMNAEIIKIVENQRPDYVMLHTYQDQVELKTLDTIGALGSKVIAWFSDDHWRFENYSKMIGRHVFCSVTTDKISARKYKEHGLKAIRSQWASNPNYYRKINTPFSYDVTFVGQKYGNRLGNLQYLNNRGVPLEVFGKGFGRFVTFNDMIKIINATKINLNFCGSSTDNNLKQIKGRVFEVPMCGSFLLTEYVDGIEEYYQIGRDIDCFETLDEAVNKIAYYLKHDDKRIEIANSGYIRSLKEHTWVKRLGDIFDELENNQSKYSSNDSISLQVQINNKQPAKKNVNSAGTTRGKRILFTTSAAPKDAPFSTKEKRPPMGIGFLISVLREAGHEVFFIDNYLQPSNFLETDYLRENKIDSVGIYANTICFRDTLRMLYKLENSRQTNQWSGKIIVGGPHTTVAAHTIPDFVDHIVQGEGERAILNIVEGKTSDRIVRCPRIENLDSLPMPAWDYFVDLPYDWDMTFLKHQPVFTMNTSRGCPFKCEFCSVGSIWGKKYTYFSAERIVSDIEYLIKHHGAKGIYFREDNFTLNTERLKKFCNLIIQKGLNISWVCETRVSNLDREIIKLMALAGAKGFYFGVESGSQKVLDLLDKGITVEQIRNVFKWCHEFNINTAASMIVGVPGQTNSDIYQSEQLLKQINPTVVWRNVFVGIPNSKLYRFTLDNRLYEYIDDRGLVYLQGHNDRVQYYYGNDLNARIPDDEKNKDMTCKPKISVLMSVYNGQRYIEQALKSIYQQTYQDFEVVVIDDASTDRTAEILLKMKDNRTFIYRNSQNKGLTKSLNIGIKLCRGEYIARMDADDISRPQRFKRQIEFLKEHPDCIVLGCWCDRIDYNGQIHGAYDDRPTEPEGIKKQLMIGNCIAHGTAMIKRSALLKVGGYNENYSCSQDHELWLRMSETGPMWNLPEYLYELRFWDGNITAHKIDIQNKLTEIAIQEALQRRRNTFTEMNIAGYKEPDIDVPSVSVVVPCYNHARFLPEAIESIVNQTYENWECIIVNDGSTDDTEEVAKKLIARYADKKIRLVQKQNGGLADARNFGIKHAAADWILLLDSDDIYGPEFLTKAFDIINANAAVNVIFANPQMFGTKSQQWIPEEYSPQKILEKNTIVGTSLFKKELWEKTGGYDPSIPWGIEDWNFWISCSKLGLVVRRVEGKHFFYRIHKDGSMYSKMLNYWPEVKAIVRTLHPDLYEYRQLISDHELISTMHSDTLKMICEKIEKFPQLPMPYFWRGLRNERDGKINEAIRDYQISCRKAVKNDWQAYARLSALYQKTGNINAAKRNMEKTLSIRPDFKYSEDTLICSQQQNNSDSIKQKILFYYDRIGNLNNTSPAGTIIAVLNFAKAFNNNNPNTKIYLTGDLVQYTKKYESFQVIPLPPPDQREQFLAEYDIVFFATHIGYFKGINKPREQIWVLCQHCWVVDDKVSLSYSSDLDVVICLSELHKTSLSNRSFGQEKLIIIPNFIETELYSPKDINRSNHSIMFAGGLHPHKCVHILLDAFRLVRQQIKDAELHIYGDGKMWRGGNIYGNQLKSIKPQGTYFHGYVENKDMPQIYSKHSILCLPSKLETLPMVVVEAQACGCIPIVNNVGGAAATLIDGQTGLLYSPNTPEILADTIIRAIKSLDANPSIRQKATNFAHKTFSINNASEYISKLLHKINIAKKTNSIRTLLEINDIKQAEFKCQLLLKQNPDNPDIQLIHSKIMMRQENEQKANSIIIKLLENFPKHLEALNNFGLMAMQAGDSKKALCHFVKAYKFNPWDKKTVINCYKILKASEKYKDAKMLLLNYLTNVGEDIQILNLFREIDNHFKNACSRTNTISKEMLENKQDTYNRCSMNMPLISIIMPAYNSADYIGQAIESVLSQSYQNFELIITDDGSTDNTKEIIQRYNDKRIRYLYQKNKGVSSARNIAIKHAKGKFIMPLDADDMMASEFIIKHVMEFKKHPDAELIYCDVLLIDKNSNPIRIMKKPEYKDRKHLIRDLLRAGHPIVPFRFGIKRSVFDKIGYYDEDLLIGEDYDMIRRLVKVGLKIHHLSEPLHLRRMHPHSLSINHSEQKVKCHFEVIKRFTDTFNYDELFPDVAWDQISPQIRHLHAKCLTAGTYLSIGQKYVKSKAIEYSKTAFDLACSELNDCIKMDPENRDLQQLFRKYQLIQARYKSTPQQAACKK